MFFGRGDGALISTAVDLATFFRALLVEGRLLNAEMLGRMMAVLPDDPPAAEAYGLGLIADPLACDVVWGHGGGASVTRTCLTCDSKRAASLCSCSMEATATEPPP